jgi:hypothetical protein
MFKSPYLFVKLDNASKFKWFNLQCQIMVLVMVGLNDALGFLEMMFISKFK